MMSDKRAKLFFLIFSVPFLEVMMLAVIMPFENSLEIPKAVTRFVMLLFFGGYLGAFAACITLLCLPPREKPGGLLLKLLFFTVTFFLYSSLLIFSIGLMAFALGGLEGIH